MEKFIVTVKHTRGGVFYPKGATIELDAETGEKLTKSGIVCAIADLPKVEEPKQPGKKAKKSKGEAVEREEF